MPKVPKPSRTIKRLDPYDSNWSLQCKIVWKSDIRTWDKSPTNKGKLFNTTLLDVEGNEIKSTFFREAVDRFYNFLQVGKIYNFSNGQIKMANKQFSMNNCPFEINFNETALISVCENNKNLFKELSIKPIKIAEIIEQLPTFVDICAVLIEEGKLETFTSNAGKDITKYEIYLADDSNEVIKCTIFGKRCNEVKTLIDNNKEATQPVVFAIKGAKTNTYQGCSLNLLQTSQIYLNQDIEQKKDLLTWMKSAKNLHDLKPKKTTTIDIPITERKTCEYVKQLETMVKDKVQYVTIKGTVSTIRKQNMSYTACPEQGNNRKVDKQEDGTYFCPSNGQTYSNCEHRYKLNIMISDETGGVWVTAFNEQAMKLIGHSASEMIQLREQGNYDEYENIIRDALYKQCLYTISIKYEVFGGVDQKKCVLVDVKQINPYTEAKELNNSIHQFQPTSNPDDNLQL